MENEPELARFLARVRPAAWRNPSPRSDYDLVIIGAGPAGLTAARAARGLGLIVALVERHWLGGNSLNVGSIPSKSWVRSGQAVEAFIDGQRFGAPASAEPMADFGAVMARMRSVRNRIAEYCSVDRLAREGIEVFFGEAQFAGAHSVRVGTATLRFKKALIATGAAPRASTIPGLTQIGYLTSTTIFDLDTLPKRLAVIGGGPLGCEMAQAFARMGTRVTILQNEPTFLPNEERDAAQILSMSLSRNGVETRLNTEVVGASTQHGEKSIQAKYNGAEYRLAVDDVLLSVGRDPFTDGARLAEAGIQCNGKGIAVDDLLRTTNPDVYAAGDVCMPYMFTNVAAASARMAVLNAFAGGDHRASRMIVPRCTYCDPEIAHLGMQVWEARRQSIPVKSFTVMMQDVDRAIIDGRDEGFVKVHVREGTDEIIGATIVANRASEMINQIGIVMNAGIGMRQLADMLHTYPAQSDALRLAAIACRNSFLDSANRTPEVKDVR